MRLSSLDTRVLLAHPLEVPSHTAHLGPEDLAASRSAPAPCRRGATKASQPTFWTWPGTGAEQTAAQGSYHVPGAELDV